MGDSAGDAVGGGIPGGTCLSGIPDADWTKNVRVPRGANVPRTQQIQRRWNLGGADIQSDPLRVQVPASLYES